MNMQNAPDWNAVRGSTAWYVDYFLDRLKRASDSSGFRLLDALDLHWYPEAQGDCRIIFDPCNQTSVNQITARLQAPRSLWDSTYVETSWIAQGVLGNRSINLVPRLFASINRYYPGTNLSFSEVTYGGEGHVSGGLAMADFLGVAGRMGVFAANFWPLESNTAFVNAAYRLYRNYDGNRSAFSAVSTRATASDNALASVFAGFDADSNVAHVIVVNKSQTAALHGTFNFTSPAILISGRVFGFESGASAVAEKTAVASIAANSFAYDLPPLSARHFVLQASAPLAAKLTPRNGTRKRFFPPTGWIRLPFSPEKTATPDGRIWPLK
jgi:hypothetical protein